MCCDESGGVVDDLIAYLVSDDDVFLVPNAANTAEVVRRLAAAAPPGVGVHDQHRDYGVLAVQGPRSAELLDAARPADRARLHVVPDRRSSTVRPCRCAAPATPASTATSWCRAGRPRPRSGTRILAAGADLGVRPCGLGARDTLRTEMGYPLHGQDLSPLITPVQARSGWAVGWDKPAFWGRDALLAERSAGAARLLWGLLAQDRGIPRPHMQVRSGAADQRVLGEVTSGTFSPTLRQGIGLALLDRAVEAGDEVVVDVRGRPSTMRVVRPPFVHPDGLR